MTYLNFYYRLNQINSFISSIFQTTHPQRISIFFDIPLLTFVGPIIQMNNKHDPFYTIPIFQTQSIPHNLLPKLNPIIDILNSPEINIHALREHLNHGIPDEAHLIRQYCWKVALGYLPRERWNWGAQIEKQQTMYNQFIRQFLHPQKYKDYPIIFDKQYSYMQKTYEKDFYLWEQIEKDTCRTQSELSFFSTPAPPIQIPFFTSTRKEKHKLITGTDKCSSGELSKQQLRKTYRYDYMTRILFIFARLNPKIQYVQGMNEIIAPIFYVVNHSHKNLQQAACFYMFNNVMSDLLQLHMKDFGKKENGVHQRMQNISTMLLAFQPKTWYRLQILKIDPFYYCFRWITLLFSQQFQLFETLRIWQSIISCEDRTAYVNFFALALIIASKQAIVNGQYGEILSYLKTISEHVNISKIIEQANYYYGKYALKDIMDLANRNLKKIEKDQQKKQKDKNSNNRLVKFIRNLF